MTKVEELNKLAEKVIGTNPQENTIKEVLDEITSSLAGEKIYSVNIADAIKNLTENYTGGGGGGESEYNAKLQDVTGSGGTYKFITKIDLKDLYIKTLNNGFKDFTRLEEVKNINTTGVKDFSYAFSNCTNLTSVPDIDTSTGTDFSMMCYSCTSLENLPILNLSNITNTSKLASLVSNCGSLTNESLHNVIKSLTTAHISSGTKTLAYIGMTEAQAAACTAFNEWTTLSAGGWTTGFVG